MGKGQNGEPDVFWSTENTRYGVEVKSVGHGTKCNAFKLSGKSWGAFCEFCALNELKPILIGEALINGSKDGPNHHWILKKDG